VVDGLDMRVAWCKAHGHALEDLEPGLVDYEPKLIDIDRMTLRDGDVPLVFTGLTLRNYRKYDEFFICRQCGKTYWQGAHWHRRTNQHKPAPAEDDSDDDGIIFRDDDDDGIIFHDAESAL
jgi:hypothetical protein